MPYKKDTERMKTSDVEIEKGNIRRNKAIVTYNTLIVKINMKYMGPRI